MLRRIFITIIIAMAAFTGAVPGEGFAAAIPTVTVDPVTVSLTVREGDIKKGTYTVKNESGLPLHVTVTPRYWYMRKENEDIPLDSWLKIRPAEFDIDPSGTKEVAYEVSPPEGMKGELAAMIAFKPEPRENQPVNIVFSVSLYMVLLGTEEVECRISDFDLWKHEQKKALGIRTRLMNIGNTHVKPRISVEIQDVFGKRLRRGVLRLGQPTYPDQERDYFGDLYNFQLNPGLYKAHIKMEYTNIARSDEKTIYFLVGRKGKILFEFFRRTTEGIDGAAKGPGN